MCDVFRNVTSERVGKQSVRQAPKCFKTVGSVNEYCFENDIQGKGKVYHRVIYILHKHPEMPAYCHCRAQNCRVDPDLHPMKTSRLMTNG